MNDMHLEPYLGFNGNTREAMEFYQSVLGGELSLDTFGKTMPEGTAEEDKDKIMHAALKSGSVSFFASDAMPDNAVDIGTNVSMCLGGSDEAHLTEVFNKLSAGGQITSPLKKEIWGDVFGMFIDKFGVCWMVNIDASKVSA